MYSAAAATIDGVGAVPVTATCPKCGKSKAGKLTCCVRGGAWFRNCGNPGDPKFEHTWTEGIESCNRKLLYDTMCVDSYNVMMSVSAPYLPYMFTCTQQQQSRPSLAQALLLLRSHVLSVEKAKRANSLVVFVEVLGSGIVVILATQNSSTHGPKASRAVKLLEKDARRSCLEPMTGNKQLLRGKPSALSATL